MDNKFLIQTEHGPMRFRGYKIRERREKLGLTPQDVGERAGLPAISVKRTEDATNVTVETLLRVARAVNLKPEVLLKESASISSSG